MGDALLRVVIDTNVWISAFINPVGVPARLISLVRDRSILLVLSDYLVEEIQDVVRRPRILRRLKLEPSHIDIVLHEILFSSVYVVTDGMLRICRDPDDDAILETAVRGRADYLVTRDDHIKRDADLMAHLADEGVGVISLAELLRRVESTRPVPRTED
ncbi:MAG: putative toxin-antitoxin system toxin component, PIN family [Chloroflexi bacterium]|nr:putative toxin-antitoxin system toxin component, PIN family [Chloroflexota bacterium]